MNSLVDPIMMKWDEGLPFDNWENNKEAHLFWRPNVKIYICGLIKGGKNIGYAEFAEFQEALMYCTYYMRTGEVPKG